MSRGNIPRIDLHVHSEFSPCAQDVTVEKDLLRAEELGIRTMAVTDHGDERRPKWISEYRHEVERLRKGCAVEVLTGIEAQILPDGKPAVEASLLKEFDVVIGALHGLPSLEKSETGIQLDEYARAILGALEGGWMAILAHATDVAWRKVPVPRDLALKILQTAKNHDIAVELNYHHRDPSQPFVRACVEAGVELAPNSDAHRLDEIGHYDWHRQVLGILDRRMQPKWYSGLS